jgi:hypothetical protein
MGGGVSGLPELTLLESHDPKTVCWSSVDLSKIYRRSPGCYMEKTFEQRKTRVSRQAYVFATQWF